MALPALCNAWCAILFTVSENGLNMLGSRRSRPTLPILVKFSFCSVAVLTLYLFWITLYLFPACSRNQNVSIQNFICL